MMNFQYMILAVMWATLIVARKAWKFRAERDSIPILYDAGAELHQLRYQANWELVAMLVDDKPFDYGYI